MTARLPAVLEAGQPMIRRIRHEFHIGTRAPGTGDVVRLPYPAVTTDPRTARLMVRGRERDQRTEIPANTWEFVDERTIRLLPAGTLFVPYKIYELWYEATGSRVTGVGFAATRDLVSFLRYQRADCDGTPNPLAAEESSADTGITCALAFIVALARKLLIALWRYTTSGVVIEGAVMKAAPATI